jgi:hypothetical protein
MSTNITHHRVTEITEQNRFIARSFALFAPLREFPSSVSSVALW